MEPRVLALLPGLLIETPTLFEDARDLPEDLAEVVGALRRNETPRAFRGIPGEELGRWLTPGGFAEGAPRRLKAFRLKPAELVLLGQLSAALGVTETDVVRAGLRELAAKHLDRAPKNG